MADMMRRPLPSFEQWLNDNGDGTRGDGFAAFVDVVERTIAVVPAAGLGEDEALFLSLWKGMGVAVVELCNLEHQRGVSPERIIKMMPRVLGAAAMYATASVLTDDAPWRRIATILIEEFRFAAKEAADQMTEKGGTR